MIRIMNIDYCITKDRASMGVTGPCRRTYSLPKGWRTCSTCLYYRGGGGRSGISGVCVLAGFAGMHNDVFAFAGGCGQFAEGVVCYSTD